MTPLLAISAQSLAAAVALVALLELVKCTDWLCPRRKAHFFGIPLAGSNPKPPSLPTLGRRRSPGRRPFLSSASRCNAGHRPDSRSTTTTKTSVSL